VARAEAYLHAKFHLDPSNRLIRQRHRQTGQTDRQDRQQFDSIGRTVLQKVAQKPIWSLMKQEMMGWQWHQLNHAQIICISLQTDDHTSISSLNVLHAGCCF